MYSLSIVNRLKLLKEFLAVFVNQELFLQLPHQRKLSTDEEAKAAKLLNVKANKKMV